MLETVFVEALQKQPFTIMAFAVAIIALWRAFVSANRSRVIALEKGLAKCLNRHQRCEDRNRELILAVVDAAEGRDHSAMERCRQLLVPDPEDEEEEK